jgi:hypothetical protein
MPDEAGDPAAAADRLEAALERIARARPRAPGEGTSHDRVLAARLDALIETLRGALAAPPTEQG